MVKPLLLLAVAANILILVSSTRYNRRRGRNQRTPRRTVLCLKNEIWAQCPEAVCAPKTCDDVGFLLPCYDLNPNGTCPSKPSCICKEGFVRNSRRQCVPIDYCPSCGGDQNARPGCGTNCNKLCSNYNKKNVFCTEQCFYNACDCKDGYVFDELIRKCVRPKQCRRPIKCKKRNEVYDPCPSSCPPRTCGINDAAVSCVPALPNGHPDCPPPACRCRDGYYRNHLGNCVLWENCPRCKRPNEVYDPCPAPCPPRTCDVNEALILCQVAPQLGDPECKPACRCSDGFVKNQTVVCIPKEQCPRCTKPNQVYDPCIVPCPPRRCGVDKRLIKCAPPPQVGDPLCEAGCRCADGYVTNSEGECIPEDECPTSCNGDPNAVSGCGVYCNQRCRDVGKKPGACILLCRVNACDCRKGYYLDENTGKCVLPQQCSPQCPYNEVYNTCIQGNCKPNNCTQLGLPVRCPRIDPRFCKKGCLCKEGYLRNEDGFCVPASECSTCGGDPNKVAGCGVYCNQRCSDIGKEPGACIDICYDNACNCRPGYYLDEKTGFCVLPEQCPSQCPLNEVYNDCIQGNCSPKDCSDLGFPVACPKIDPKFCKKGCLCKEGYLRNDNGVCVPASECPSCAGDRNKVAGCGVYCNQQCRNIGKEPNFCIEVCYENSCNCRPGYFLDANSGFCVLPEQCTPQCPVNEWYSECTQGNCSPENCTQVGFPIACPRIDPAYCKKGCLCNQGYARNEDGICIPSKECPSCRGDPNAQAGCGGNCNRHCSDIGQEPGACTLICEINGCDCKDGFYYNDETQECVKPEQCPLPKPRCARNEEYSNCTNSHCGVQSCDDLGFPTPCAKVDPEYCTEGCRCKAGYVRNNKGICVSTNECPACGGDPNAKPGCGMNCNKHCYNVGKKPGVCALGCILNGCNCKDGYYYDDQIKKCVLPKDCSPTCPKNEIFSSCINGGCQARNCSQYDKPVPCIKMDPKYCKAGCVCKEKYLRTSNGKCVPEENCPEACNGPNKEYDECAWGCPPQTCESLDKAYACPLQDDDNCEPMCKCKSGFFKNKIGDCITEEQCRQCMGPHEYYSCGGACDNVCKDLDFQSQKNCPIVNIMCNRKCYCEDGYARAKNNTCIAISSCGSDNSCSPNEVFQDCSNPVCKPERCSDVGFPLDCKSECKKGCICQDGYARDDNGRCIPIKECTSCGGDPNAVTGCGVNCGRHCSNIGNKGPVACPAICRLNGCDCKPGYYYNDKIKKCVKPEDCNAPQCPQNERYEKCPGSSCQPEYCDELGFSSSCEPQPEDGTCSTKPACVCVDGYVRDEDGKCIPKNQCPSCGDDPNAQSGCGVNCGRRCTDLIKQRPCIRICYGNACDCKEGFYYDSYQKKCVLAGQCTDICEKNEIFEDCSNPTCKAKNCTQVGLPLDCNETCVKGCVCQNGYVRDEDGICIPITECPSCGGDPNAQSGCGTNCRKRCPNNNINPLICPRIACIPELNKCDCRNGFFFDINTQNCVKLEDCSPLCNESNSEVYDSCVNGGCGWRNCSQVGGPMLCIDPIKCDKGCKCKDGYYRLNDGTCVPEEECPTDDTCGKNEIFEDCSNPTCKAKYCTQVGFPLDCDETCVKGCVCQNGYVRDEDGICIPIKECPSCGGDPNAQSGCGTNCRKRCPNNNINPRFCPRIACVPQLNKCECRDGFFFDINTKNCVKLEDCSPLCNKSNSEVYDSCVNGGCGWRNCSQVGGPILCIDPIKCDKGCKCKDGYYRLNDGTCVPVEKCPTSCGGDPNAQPGCGFNCGKRCPNNYRNPIACPRNQCVKNKCDCKDKYYFDINIKRCVLFDDCTPRCSASKNEVYDPCPPICPPQTCESLNHTRYFCPMMKLNESDCKGQCRCKPNYYRNKIGQCISKANCLKCNGPNEYYSCGPACDNVCGSKSSKNNCPLYNKRCVSQCYCVDGFARNEDKICIPIDQCPDYEATSSQED